MDCHISGRGLNPGKTKENFFLFGKIQILSPLVPHHVLFLLMARSYENSGLVTGVQKREQLGKILAAPSVEAKHRSKYNVFEMG